MILASTATVTDRIRAAIASGVVAGLNASGYSVAAAQVTVQAANATGVRRRRLEQAQPTQVAFAGARARRGPGPPPAAAARALARHTFFSVHAV